MFWLMMAMVVIVAGLLAFRRRRNYESTDAEPWRASLSRDDEPLDMDEARRAEEEWLQEEGWSDSDDDEAWR